MQNESLHDRKASTSATVSSAFSPVEALENPALFTAWRDSKTGVTSHILTRRVAPLQQSFYFVNRSLSADGRYYWFCCAHPPAGSANQGRSLAVADLREGSVHHFPETGFTDASPMVDERTGEAWWCTGTEVWRRRPEPDASPKLAGRFPDALARNRRPWRLATHLTFSADRKAVNLDVEIGGEWHVGHVAVDGGEFVPWQKFDRCYNHGQFSPTDPDLQLIAQDHFVHPISGVVHGYENRLWLIRRGGEAAPVFAEARPVPRVVPAGYGHNAAATARAIEDARALHGHEWWDAGGRHVWYVQYGRGVERVRIETGERLGAVGEPELVWSHGTLAHAHASADGRYLVCDSLPANDPTDRRVTFFDTRTRREINVASYLPDRPALEQRYHIHPHPQFCFGDRLICYTTTVLGRLDVAFTRVDELAARVG